MDRTFDHVAGHGKRSAPTNPTTGTRPASADDHSLNRFAQRNPDRPYSRSIELSMSFEVRTGLSITGPSPAANRSFRPIGSTGNRRSAKT